MEFEGLRVPMDEARERFAEAAAILTRGLETGVVEGDGPIFRQPRREIRPRPPRSFAGRTFAAAVSPESIAVIAQLGMGMMIIPQRTWTTHEADADRFRALFAEAHGAPPPPGVMAGWVFVDEDGDRAREVGRPFMLDYYRSVVSHYEIAGEHFAATKGYEHYATGAAAMREHGTDAAADGIRRPADRRHARRGRRPDRRAGAPARHRVVPGRRELRRHAARGGRAQPALLRRARDAEAAVPAGRRTEPRPRRPLTRPAREAPVPDIVDTHTHIVSADTGRYPISPGMDEEQDWHRARPVDAAALLARADSAGVGGIAFVQALSCHGYDNRYVLDAARLHAGRAIAVVAVRPDDTDATTVLEQAVADGAAGVRVVVPLGEGGGFDDPPVGRLADSGGRARHPGRAARRGPPRRRRSRPSCSARPATTFVVDHCGFADLSNASEPGWTTDSARALHALAASPTPR